MGINLLPRHIKQPCHYGGIILLTMTHWVSPCHYGGVNLFSTRCAYIPTVVPPAQTQLCMAGLWSTTLTSKLECLVYPQADIPTTIGIGSGDEVAMETEQDHAPSAPASKKKYFIDSTVVYKAREGMEMATPIRDGQSTQSYPCDRIPLVISPVRFLFEGVPIPAPWNSVGTGL